jgi:glycerol-3-phosphate dehydrogenase
MSNVHTCDIVVLGGGINGAAVARDAALRGLSVVLIESHDFAYGASGKTSKLAHGGLRYLEQREFGLVHESLRERNLLLRHASNWVQPLAFLLPVYPGHGRPGWQLKIGLTVYDILSFPSPMPAHRRLSKDVVTREYPHLHREGLRDAYLYYDAQMEDARLVIANVVDAASHGAQCFNYSHLSTLRRTATGFHVGVEFPNNTVTYWNCKAIVNTTGAWSDVVRKALGLSPQKHLVAPTKGVHVVLRHAPPKTALLLQAPQDERVFFVMPWHDRTLVGTTDTPFAENPDRLDITPDDIHYLKKAYAHFFPALPISPGDMVSAFAGLRPLAASDAQASDRSRETVIYNDIPGLFSVVGGKFTTHRQIAQDVVDKLIKAKLLPSTDKPCSTTSHPLPLPSNMASSPPQPPYCPHHPHTLSEVDYAVRYEWVRSVSDWNLRRTVINFAADCNGISCAQAVGRQIGTLLGKSEADIQADINAYVQETECLLNVCRSSLA